MSTLKTNQLSNLAADFVIDVKEVQPVAEAYTSLGAYGAGLVLNSYTETFTYAGVEHRPLTTLALPYTTTGAGAGEIANFRSVGDALLRSDLAEDSDPLLGSVLVGRASIVVTSIAQMQAYSVPAGRSFSLNAGGRSGVFDVVDGDFSTELAADTLNAVYVGLSDNPTATTKVGMRRYSGPVSVQWFGALGNGVNDDTAAFLAALSLANALSLPSLLVPSVLKENFYIINSSLVITKGVSILGEGWSSAVDYTAPNYERGAGSWIKVNNPANSAFTVQRPVGGRCSGAYFKDIAFFWDQPTPASGWAPNVTDYAFRFESVDDCKLSNVMILNPEKGVIVTGSTSYSAGRIDIDGLFGQPLRIGVNCDFSADVCRWNNIHLWPYWSDSSFVLDWQRANAIYFSSGRNDNMQGVNWFGFAYGTGLLFTSSAEGFVTSRLKLANIEFDSTKRALDITSASAAATAQISNFSAVAPPDLAGADLFVSSANGVIFDWINLRLTNSQDSSILVTGSGAIHRFSQPYLENWALAGSGSSGFFAGAGATIFVTDAIYKQSGVAPTKGGTGLIIESRDEKIFSGSLSVDGKAVIAHGVASLPLKVSSISGLYLDGVIWRPLNMLYVDGTFTELVGIDGAADSGKAYLVSVSYYK